MGVEADPVEATAANTSARLGADSYRAMHANITLAFDLSGFALSTNRAQHPMHCMLTRPAGWWNAPGVRCRFDDSQNGHGSLTFF